MPRRKILVPYDGSKKSDEAFSHSLELVRQLKGDTEIILLHVVESIILPPLLEKARSPISGEIIGPEELRKEWYQSLKANAKKMLSERERQGTAAGVKTRTMVRYGYPPQEIVKLAKEEGVDLIIMGNTGLRGVSKMRALGSVSRSVAEGAACAVMIVH